MMQLVTKQLLSHINRCCRFNGIFQVRNLSRTVELIANSNDHPHYTILHVDASFKQRLLSATTPMNDIISYNYDFRTAKCADKVKKTLSRILGNESSHHVVPIRCVWFVCRRVLETRVFEPTLDI